LSRSSRAATARTCVISRDLEIDGKLGQAAMGSKALEPVHARIEAEPGDPCADKRRCDTQGVGINLGHAPDLTLHGAGWREH